MRSKRLRQIEDLRRAIDCLPERTKHAMLEGIEANTIIVGAYTDRRGGVCPMLAAHRHGGRTDLLAFAHGWDRFCEAKRPRTATERELAVLKAHLEASLYDAQRQDLAGAIVEHQAAARDRRAAEARSVGLGWLRRRSDVGETAEVAETADEREPELV
jgi:hypothetical protein